MITTSLYLLTFLLTQNAPNVDIPAAINTSPGRLIRIEAKTEGKIIRWFTSSEEADLIPFPDGRVAIFSSLQQGKHRVFAYTASGDIPSFPAVCVITVQGAGPTPPNPPVPPDPPKPPVPPPPTDELVQKLQAAFDRDAATPSDKAAWIKTLKSFYEVMAEYANKKELKTLGELLADYRKAIPQLLPDTAILDVRRLCGVEVGAVVGQDSSPDRELTAVFRAQLSDGFTRISKALDKVK